MRLISLSQNHESFYAVNDHLSFKCHGTFRIVFGAVDVQQHQVQSFVDIKPSLVSPCFLR